MWSGWTSSGQYLGVEEIEMVIVPNLFISWLHMTTQNVCPGTLGQSYNDMCYVLMLSLMRSPEVNRSPIFDLSQNLEYRHKRPYQGHQEPTNLATFTPKYVRLGTLLWVSKLFRYWVGVHLPCKEVVNLLKPILCWIQAIVCSGQDGCHLVCGVNCSEDM